VLIVRLIVSLLVNAAALWLADALFDGVTIDGGWNLLLAAAIFGVINFLLKPVLVLFSIPLIMLTLGLFLLLINIALLGLTDWIAGDGFDINGFWTYVGTVIVVWVVNTVLGVFAKRIED
jgi:putative membrane protein